MGIPSYFSSIVKKYPNIFRLCTPKKTSLTKTNILECGDVVIDVLCFDANSIIYDVVRKIQDENDSTPLFEVEENIIQRVLDKLNEYIAFLNPQKLVYIAFDGVAPMAKLEQQRQRRFKSHFQKSYFHKYKRGLEHKNKDLWNTVAITPGTEFMDKLCTALSTYFTAPSTDLQIILSLSDTPGEGEHKIFEFLRQECERSLLFRTTYTTLIYGLDADLFMLSLNHLRYQDNLFLYRETPDYIHSLQNLLSPEQDYFIDVQAMMMAIQGEMTMQTQIGCVDDYVFMCFFLGNDFLPHFPALNIRTNGIDKLLAAYKSVFSDDKVSKGLGCLVVNDLIQWPNVTKWLSALAEQEDEFMKREMGQRMMMEKKWSRMKLDCLEDTATEEKREQALNILPITSREKELYIWGGKEDQFQKKRDWRSRYYDCLFQKKNKKMDVFLNEICQNYVEGLQWTFQYYSSGIHTATKNPNWCYVHHYPPLLRDLKTFLGSFKNDDGMKQTVDSSAFQIDPLTQLAYVLPRELLTHLIKDKKISFFLLNKLSMLYPSVEEAQFEWSFCKYFWESHAILPKIDLLVLQTELNCNRDITKA